MLDGEVFIQKIADEETALIAPPYDPDGAYPECPLEGRTERNYVYEAVREMFHRLGYDAAHYGTKAWNPLGEFIRPGHRVLIKPNMVLHRSYRKGEDYMSVVTHPALIRAVVDYVYIALRGNGSLTVGDAPLNSADFTALKRNMGLDAIVALYAKRGFSIRIADFRLYTMQKDEHGVISNQQSVASKDDHCVVRLDGESLLRELDEAYRNYRVTEYDGAEMPSRHNPRQHAYCIHRSVCEADVIISLPKVKTHHKAGYTCAMKNYIGINGSKDWLPHHRKNSVAEGGDEYLHRSLRKKLISGSWDRRWKVKSPAAQRPFLMFERFLRKSRHLVPYKDMYMEGSWWGNRTISRTVNDLNRVVLYCDTKGVMQDTPQRKILYLVDGIICGEGEGPMEATSKRCNMLVWGHNAYAVDMAVVTLMGFDHARIDTLNVCQTITRYKVFAGRLADIRIQSNLADHTHTLSSLRTMLGFTFVPSHGWQGHIELSEEACVTSR